MSAVYAKDIFKLKDSSMKQGIHWKHACDIRVLGFTNS